MEEFIVGPYAEVAGVAPGGTVTRAQVEGFGRVEGEHEPHIHVDVLVKVGLLVPKTAEAPAKTLKAGKDAP